MNSHSLKRDTNKIGYEAACNRLLESIGHATIMRIRADLKAMMEAMAADTKAQVVWTTQTHDILATAP